ncbi:MAG: hypothetical protein JNG83_10720 [Opitutaceae bacterium]|nr:hypothetical protein [Opitutaceae bacterium]
MTQPRLPLLRRRGRFLGAILLLLFALDSGAATRRLTLNGLELEFDAVTGGLVALSYPQVGRILAAERETAGLLDVAFPVSGYVPMRLATRFSAAEFEQTDRSLTITWPKLAPSRTHVSLPEGYAHARVTITAAPDGRSVLLRCRIENHFAQPLPQVLFPDLAGLRAIGSPEDTKLTMARGAVTPFTQKAENRHRAAFWPVDGGWRIYEATAYSYGPNVMNWLDYGSLQGGFSLFQRKWRDRDYRRPDILTRVTDEQPDRLRLACWQPGRVAPGETWESAEYVLTPHVGGWAKGAEVYRQYIREVTPPHEIPRRIREGLGYLSVWMSDSQETVPELAAMRYKDLPAIARDAREHGLDELVAWRWCTHLRMPIPHREVLGTEDEWIAAIKECRDLGVHVSGALGIHLLHHTQLPRYGVAYTARNAWNFHRDLIPNFNPVYLKGLPLEHAGQTVPPSNRQWQEDVVSSLGAWIDRGLTSFTWDVYGGGGPDGPLSSRYEDNVALNQVIKQVRARARKLDPESSFNAETNSISGLEWDGEVLDYTWNWMSNQVKEGHLTTTTYLEIADASPIINVLPSPRVNYNIESTPLAVKQGFADGAYLNFLLRKPDGENGSAILGEKPALSPVVKQAAARRKQFLAFFTEGVPVGDCILARTSPAYVRGHILGDGALVIVINDDAEARAADLRLALPLWLKGDRHRVTRYDADGRLTGRETVSVKSGVAHLKGRKLAAGDMEFIVIGE